MHILVIYDISDNRKRRRAVKLLNGCGTRVQESAFECVISDTKASSLEKKISALIDETDSVRIYRLSSHAKISVYGTSPGEIFSSNSFLII